MTKRELTSRHEIFLEEYSKKIRIEGNCARDIASQSILPAAKAEYLETAKAVVAAEKAGAKAGLGAMRANLDAIGIGLDALQASLCALDAALGSGPESGILAAMNDLRAAGDSLEKRVSDARWPLPKYRDMLFLY